MFDRFFYRQYRRFYRSALVRKNRFTPSGWMVIMLFFLTGLFGINSYRSMTYQIFSFVFPILILSFLYSLFFRIRLTTKRKLPDFVTAGRKFEYTIEFTNHNSKPEKGLIFSEELSDPRPDFNEFLQRREPGEEKRIRWDRWVKYHRWLWIIAQNSNLVVKEEKLETIPPKSTITVHHELTPIHRGYINLEGVRVMRPDPFGLMKAGKLQRNKERLLVLPKRYTVPKINLSGHRKHHSGGVALATSIGNSEEFISLRDYRPGDSMRMIHWKSWAKTGEMIIRENHDEYFVRHAIILDTFTDKKECEIFEEAVSVAASFITALSTKESILDLMFVGNKAYHFSAGRGTGRVSDLLEVLASVRTCRDKQFSSISPMIERYAKLLSGCVIVLIKWDDERRECIEFLKALGISIQVYLLVETDISANEVEGLPIKILKVGEVEACLKNSN